MPQMKLTPKQISGLNPISLVEIMETKSYCQKMMNIAKKQTTKEVLKNKIALCNTILFYAVKSGDIEVKL